MSIQTQYFESARLRLGPIDYDKDPAVESRWTHDPAYQHGLGLYPARPLSPAQMKKKYEAIEKNIEESHNTFHFMVTSKEDDRLIGMARIEWIEWSHGAGELKLAIGDPQERRKGYGSELMELMLRFAFDELNLYRLSVMVSEDNTAGLALLKKFGFVEEVRRRKALHRNGQYIDLLHFGLLHSEWKPQEQSQP
jgi:RimJ/RimL family protein N-acetyltransferase